MFNALYSQIHEIPRRSKWATRELAEFLKYCYNDQLDPQEIGGSYAGALMKMVLGSPIVGQMF